MRTAVAALCLALFPIQAIAVERYTSTAMNCAEVKATVRGAGAAILQYRSTRNPSLPLYGRYVRDRLYCKHNEVTETVYVPTADTRLCPVYECKQVDVEDHFPRILRRRD